MIASTRSVLVFSAASLLFIGVAHTAPPPTAAPAQTASTASAADEEDAAEQKTRRDAYIKKAFERFDTNKDGNIDAAEFRVGLERFLDRQRAAFDRDFDETDTNHDGKLSRAETRKGNPNLAEHFADIDANKDGFLTKSEIRAAIREQQMRASVEGDGEENTASPEPSKSDLPDKK